MTREELMKVAKPILFNTEMVRAILDGRKTVTRRCVKYKYSNTEMKMHTDKYGTRLIEIQKDVEGETFGKNPDGTTWHKLLGYIEPKSPYRPGNILYVRETWKIVDYLDNLSLKFEYEADGKISDFIDFTRDRLQKFLKYINKKGWCPALFMPKEAARIFLRVTDVRVERLRDITDEQAIKEGFEGVPCNCNGYPCTDCMNTGWIEPPQVGFMYTWDSTIKKSDLDRYGWDANPWVWVIEFARVMLNEHGA